MTFSVSLFVVGVALGTGLGAAAVASVGTRTVNAAQLAHPDTVRFQLASDEPIAMPDGRSLLNHWKVVVMRDVKSDQCYTIFLLGASMSATGPATCPNERR
jgi:hypothetical protein